MTNVYLDYNASTPIAPEVVDAICPFLSGHYGNSPSLHWVGAPAKRPVEKARSQVAASLGCTAQEIIFTGGDTEAYNQAITEGFFSLHRKGNHIITNPIEHPAVLFHTDAARSVGIILAKVSEFGVDLLSVAGRKLYAPKGLGVLYLRQNVQLEPLLHGAGHEAKPRAGTESTSLTTALGQACEIDHAWIGMLEVQRLRDLFWERLRTVFANRVTLNGHLEKRLPNTLNVSFVGRNGTNILTRMPTVATSTVSA